MDTAERSAAKEAATFDGFLSYSPPPTELLGPDSGATWRRLPSAFDMMDHLSGSTSVWCAQIVSPAWLTQST